MFDLDKASPKKAFICTLPDELLTTILDFAARNACSPWQDNKRYNYDSARTLASVCHRFKRIALPLLYHTINLDLPLTKRVKELHGTLRKNPTLGQYCQTLSVLISDSRDITEDGYSIANDLVSWLTKVRFVYIHGGFDERRSGKSGAEDTWALIRNAAHNMREVDHVYISRVGFGLYLDPIMENIGFPLLRKLDISGISENKKGAVVLDPKKRRTAPFTMLSISDYEESPEATAQLLQWPKALTHFRFGNFYNNDFYFDLPMLHSWLLNHKDTLKTIHIGYMSRAGIGRQFRASDFLNLEVLRLSRWQTGSAGNSRDLKFSAADADCLLAPNIKTFGWDFSVFDQHSEGWDDFGDLEENWVRELARAAIVRKAALRKIEIGFSPEGWRAREEYGYPWDRMDKIHNEIQPYGLTLEYNTPTLTKEEWLEETKPRVSSPTADTPASDTSEQGNSQPVFEARS